MPGHSHEAIAYWMLAFVAGAASVGIWLLMVVDEGRSVGAATLEMIVKFTNLTVVLVAVVAAWIALGGPPSARRTIAHLSITVMAVVTALVNATLLDPALPSGPWGVVDLFQHYLIPAALVGLWAIVGPRFARSRWRLTGVLALPFLWLVFVLARGALSGSYPYDFLDVERNGWPSVLVTVALLLAVMLAFGAALTAIDRRRT